MEGCHGINKLWPTANPRPQTSIEAEGRDREYVDLKDHGSANSPYARDCAQSKHIPSKAVREKLETQ